MKHISFVFCFAFVALCAVSCSSEDGPNPAPCPPLIIEHYIIDGAKLENIQLSHKKSAGQKGYGDLRLFINLNRTFVYDPFEPVAKEETSYFIDRYAFVQDSCNSYRAQRPDDRLDNPSYFAAYVNGNVKITCDKTLFGKEPGEAINEFLALDKGYSPMRCYVAGVEFPHFLYALDAESPTSMDQIFMDQAWLFQNSYVWYFPEIPTERYSNITFRLTFPVLVEHSWDWAESVYWGGEDKKIYSEEIFISECTVTFKWND